MKNVRFASSFLQMVGWLIVAVAAVAWQPGKTETTESKNLYTNDQDTTVPKSANTDQIDFQLNLDSVMKEVNLAISKIDYAKINADVQKAMAQVDYNKINKEINSAMKSIDWSQMKIDVSQSLDSAKMAIDKIDWDKMKAEMKKAQVESKKEMANQKISMDSIQIQVQKSLKEAQKSLQSAQAEFASYKGLKAALVKDGLIKTGKPYSIQLKDGNLYINGIKQTQAVTDKYSKYYSGKKNFMFKDDGTDL